MEPRGIRRISIALVCVATVFGGHAAAAPQDPVHVELFAHGVHSAGEAHVGDALRGRYMPMDKHAPTSDVPKSIGFTNVGVVPNPKCAGSPYFPVWVGEVGGHITGEVVFEFHVVSSPGGKVEVRVWPDMTTIGCDEDYREPSARTVVDLPVGSGEVTAIMGGVDFESATNIMVQVTPLMQGVTQGRVLFDSRQHDTSLSFDCTPLWSDTCKPYDGP